MTGPNFEVNESGTRRALSDSNIRMQAIRHHVHQIMELATTITQQPPSQRHQSCQKINRKGREILSIVSQQINADSD